MEAAGTPLQHHYYCSINYHLIGTQSLLAGPGSFMCHIQVFNNTCVLTLFFSFWGANHWPDREWTETEAQLDKAIWVERGRRGRDTSEQMCRHKKADLVIVEPKRGLSCNEARAPVRGRFLSEAASSFFCSSVKEMWWRRRGASSVQTLRRSVRAPQECAPLTA